jgi:N-acetylmuramic acid 6-phosphate etherase
MTGVGLLVNLATGRRLETITHSRVPDDYLDARLTERRNPRTATIDTASALEIVDLIGAEDATVPAAVARAREDIARGVDLIEQAFRAGGRLVYVGAGTSGRLGVLDAAECPPTFGTPPEMVLGVIAGGHPALVKSVEGAEDDVNAAIGEMDARRVGPDDVVIGIAASGTTPFVRAALSRAQTLGARTAIVTCSEPPKLLRETCDVCILVLVGPEVVTGSTRMKAGTATKLVLNTLTTAAMIRLGKTYGNLMVDLRAWNDKLIDRSERIVMETTGVPRAEARGVIEAAEGKVKTAIVMARRRVSRDEAERLLEEHEGRLRTIVGDPPPVRTA